MDIQGFHHLAIQVRDVELCTAFYRDVLGLTEQVRHRRDDGSLRSVWLALPDGGFLALEAVSGAPTVTEFRHQTPGYHLLALRIGREARPHVLAELAQRGIEVIHQTRWTVYVRDPEGNRVGLSHHPEDPL
jgi:glyoxylase I family protein